MDPAYADGWVNVARARIQEGNMAAAEEMLRKALEVDPKLAKTHFFLGTALKSLGRYDEALGHLREAARSVSARPRRPQPVGPRALPEASVSRRRSTSSSRCCRSIRRICRRTTT